MSQRQSSIDGKPFSNGFSLLEVVVSIAILCIGLVSVAALVSGMMTAGTGARYTNMANLLASEKLDSLNKWPSGDPNVAAGGALTGPEACASGDDYCDQVTMTEFSGADYESQTQIINGASVTTTIVHTNTGCVDTPTNCGVSAPTGTGSTFTRRWLITNNPTIIGANGTTTTATGSTRITVVVKLNDQRIQPPVTFQMSMVRP